MPSCSCHWEGHHLHIDPECMIADDRMRHSIPRRDMKTEDILRYEKANAENNTATVAYVDGKMTNEEALRHQKLMFEDALGIMTTKRHDYSGLEDPFRNLRDAEFMGVDPLKGVMVRIMDKFARVRSFIEQGELKVKDEAIKDTLVDVLNYTCILAAMIEEQSNVE